MPTHHTTKITAAKDIEFVCDAAVPSKSARAWSATLVAGTAWLGTGSSGQSQAGAISESAYVAGLERAGLTDVEVQDRLVYEATQIDAFLKSELSGGEGCCGVLASLTPEMIEKLSAAAVGKIWSARVYGRKPERC